MRQYLIAERLADTRGIAYDRELLLCASFLHDAGLRVTAPSRRPGARWKPTFDGVRQSLGLPPAKGRG